MNGTQRGFTLIELLLVISIIGLLSTVVLQQLNSAREKGRVASLLQFSDSIYHSIGYAAVDTWHFNEGGGTTARDSASSRSCTLSGSASLTENGVVGKALRVSGGGYCGESNKAIVPTNKLTVEAFFYPEATTATMGTIYAEMEPFPTRGIYIYTQNNSVICRFVDNTGANVQLSGTFLLNKWNHIACTYDGAQVRLYVNAQLIPGAANMTGTIGASTLPGMRAGNNPNYSNSAFTGYIDRVIVYAESFSL